MKKITASLIGASLDLAVAKASGLYAPEPWISNPSTDWAQGGPLIEREGITTAPDDEGEWVAHQDGQFVSFGATILIAAMRCFVASKLGDEVEIPEGL